MNCFIDTSDVNTGNTLSIVTDRSQAGASLANGQLELMVQRRIQKVRERRRERLFAMEGVRYFGFLS